MDRGKYGRWIADGNPSLADRAHRKVKEFLLNQAMAVSCPGCVQSFEGSWSTMESGTGWKRESTENGESRTENEEELTGEMKSPTESGSFANLFLLIPII